MPRLSHGELLQLKRWNTPTIYNGWEQITQHDAARDGFNLEETLDFMPQMGVMVGYAVTVVCEPSERRHKENKSGFVDFNECHHLISIARGAAGGTPEQLLADLEKGSAEFGRTAFERFQREGEF